MFSFLKKKLKESIEKITKKTEEKIEISQEIHKKHEDVEIKKEEEKSIIHKITKKLTEKELNEEDMKDLLEELHFSLVQSDVASEVADRIVSDLKSNLIGKSVKRNEIEKLIKESFRKSIEDVLDVPTFDIFERIKSKKPFLIIFLGFNGAGKTTTIARVGHLLKEKGITSIFAAGDTWRAASIEQIEEHGKKLGIEVIKHKYGADPAAVIFDAVKHAESNGIDVILADTAGRSHANLNLMEELKKIIRVNKPGLKILVLDSLTGNDIYDQCKLFNDTIGVDALILTKADVYEKGGAALSASFTIKKPTLFIGVGQGYKDLEEFNSNKILENLLGQP